MALSIIDSHIHFWDPKKLRYSWLKGVPTINHAHYPKDVVRAAAEDCIAQAAEGGGYILSGTDAGIYSSHWVESFLVMAEVARTHTYG